MVDNVIAIIGAVSGLMSLAGVVYMVGYWKGNVDSNLKTLCEHLEKYPPAETSLRVKTLWDIYIMDALRSRPDLAQHQSSFKLKPVARDLIPEKLKLALNALPNSNTEDIATGWLVVKTLSMDPICKIVHCCYTATLLG